MNGSGSVSTTLMLEQITKFLENKSTCPTAEINAIRKKTMRDTESPRLSGLVVTFNQAVVAFDLFLCF